MSDQNIGTICVQGGYSPKNGEPRIVPIAQSTTYKYDSTKEVGDLFDLKTDGFFYTRLANPTADAVEKKLAALEGGVGAMLTGSGQAASLCALLTILKEGDHVLSSAAIYGGTFNLFNVTLRRLGIEFDFVDPDAGEDELKAAITAKTRAVFVETVSNPALVVTDIEKFARIAHGANIPLIVDNTFPTPVNCCPIEWGADIVVHSTSKYLDGHAAALGGAVVDGGTFDWANGNFPGFTTPDESYHGVVYTEQFGKAAFIAKARTQMMRDLGTAPAPMNAFLLNIGMETLHLRMARHCENALILAEHLKNHPKIEYVSCPMLKGDKYYELSQKYMPGGCCGVLSIGIKGGREAAVRFMDALKLAAIVVHVADARTGVLHPASSTHRQLTDEQLAACGVKPNQVRVSVGIEDIEDIIADFDQALEQA